MIEHQWLYQLLCGISKIINFLIVQKNISLFLFMFSESSNWFDKVRG